MAKFCGKCGSRLDEATGLCPRCDAEQLRQLKEQKEQPRAEANQTHAAPHQPPNRKMAKKEKKAAGKAEKKAARKARRAAWSTGKRVRRAALKGLLVILLLAVLAGGIAYALDRLGLIEAPFVSGLLEWTGLCEPQQEVESDFSILEGGFTNITVQDAQSAIRAAKAGARKLGIADAAEELSLDSVTQAGELAYYRLQQNYQGYPVYGKSFVVIAGSDGEAAGMTSNCFSISVSQMQPAITQEEADNAVRSGILALTDAADLEQLETEPLTDDKLCIYTQEDHSARLAYQLCADTEYGPFTVFVDACNAEVLFCEESVVYAQKEFTYRGQNGTRTFTAEAGDAQNQMHYFGPDGTKITVYTPASGHQADWYYDGNANVVSWTDAASPDRSAVDAMAHVAQVYNYYRDAMGRASFDGNGEPIDVYVHTVAYRDYKGNDRNLVNNAYFWRSPNGPIVSFTKRYDSQNRELNEYSCELDVVGHEFTHGIVSYTARLFNTKTNQMPSAINEAVADIMGYCAEATILGRRIDWTNSLRSSIKGRGQNSGYIYHVNDYKGSNKECHAASTIVSYAAYMMNVSQSGALSDDEIASLWYHTILTLPSNCTFQALRQNVEMTARNLKLSEKKRQCIARAFDAVGIGTELSDADQEYSTMIDLNVFDYRSAAYDDYTVAVDGVYNTGWFGWSWFGIFQKEYHEQYAVHSSLQQTLQLPDHGEYTIKITDNQGSAETYEKPIKVKKKNEKSTLTFATCYGEPKSDAARGGEFDPSELPDGAVEFNGHYYYLYDAAGLAGTEVNTWENARDYCAGVGGYLATITSQDENDFLYSYITQQGCSDAFFGFTDEETEGYWGWVTGEAADYTNWHAGEPNNDGGSEDYGSFFYKNTDGTWNDGRFGNDTSAFLCEWGEYEIAPGNQPDPREDAEPAERDIVLTLDISGSMDGTPLQETKKASVKFVETALEEDAAFGIVTYDYMAYLVSDFSMNRTALENAISNIRSGGSTNIEDGLRQAQAMLSESRADKKIILLMSDGAPNDGLQGDDLIAYANAIKDTGVRIYTLGFFSSVGGSKSAEQLLMEQIASEGCHYEVANADDLVFFFQDMADQISGQKYIYVRIACPVDVSVTYQGQTLSSAEKEQNLRTDFGTLTFEDNEAVESGADDRVKVLRLKEGAEYDLHLEGTGRGLMDYTIGFMDDEGNYSDLRRFRRVKITRRTVIETVAAASEQSTLNIDEDGDGRVDLRLRADANGYGKEVKSYTLVYAAAGGALLLLIVCLVLVRKVRRKRRKVR